MKLQKEIETKENLKLSERLNIEESNLKDYKTLTITYPFEKSIYLN